PRPASRRPERNRGFPPPTRGKHHRLRGSNPAMRRPRLAARATTRGISPTLPPKTFRSPVRISTASKRPEPLTCAADSRSELGRFAAGYLRHIIPDQLVLTAVAQFRWQVVQCVPVIRPFRPTSALSLHS